MVHRGAAGAPAGPETNREGILAAGFDRGAGPLQPARPDLRAVEISERPRRPAFQDEDSPARLSQLGGEQAAGGAGADYDDIHFVHGGYHLSGGMICAIW